MRKLRVLSSLVVGILVWALVFAGCSGSSTIAITLSSTATSVNPGQTATITATLTHDRNNQGVTWTLTGPGQLSGNTTTSVVYTAPPTVATSTTATITATSVANTTITTTQSITLTAVLTITTTSLPSATLGVAYDAFVNAAGAPAPFTWSVKSGTLPAGLTFQTTSTSPSAEITGTPTVLGTSDFTVQVTDSSDATVTQALNITVNRPPPLSVATGSLQDGTVNVPYSQTLQASSGVQPYTWAITVGTLPIGLALNSTTGVISGTPIATETSNFTVEVKDSSTPQQSATASLSITIGQGVTYNSKLSGPYAFMVRGFDPNGLFVAAGSFVADGAGNISAGIMDINDTASDPSNPTFTGTYSIGQNGFGSMTFNVAGAGTRMFELTLTAGGNANIIEFDDSTGGGTRNSGVVLKQTTSPPFSNSSVNGNYAFGFLGIDSGKNRFGLAGNLRADGAGNLTCSTPATNCSLDSDSISAPSSSVLITGGTYSVASNGRGTLNIKTALTSAGYSFYIVNSSELLLIETDTFPTGGNPLVSGTILGQTSNSSFNSTGVFEVTGLNASGPTAESQIGLFQAANGGFTLTSDQNAGGTLTSPTGAGSYSIDQNGRVSLSASGSGFQNSSPVLYMVSDNEAFIIGTDTAVSFGFMAAQAQPGTYTSASLSGTYAGGSLATVDPSVSNVASIAIAGSGTLNITYDASGPNGLSAQNQISATTSVQASGRVTVTVAGNTTEILYLVSPPSQASVGEFFLLTEDSTARVDIFQQ